MHAGTPPIGELGALCHLDSFVPSVLHSSLSSVCISSCLSVPFGDEVPTTQPHTQHPQFTPPSPILSRSQLKRKHRSQGARQHRQQKRIQRRAAARRAYRSWIQHLTSNKHIYGKGSINAVHQPKPPVAPHNHPRHNRNPWHRTPHTDAPHSICSMLDGKRCNRPSTQPHSNTSHTRPCNQNSPGSRATPGHWCSKGPQHATKGTGKKRHAHKRRSANKPNATKHNG